ncbi:ATP-binding cassette domain-containing protein [Streptomyces sp. B6B3]|uniref:ABC transporter ATP-binding protein n=1 Tax=Streptomyces sp. B6B3 TaxID=3153570 RepID=UPI00325EA5C7
MTRTPAGPTATATPSPEPATGVPAGAPAGSSAGPAASPAVAVPEPEPAALRLDGVGLGYPGAEVLTGLDLSVAPGEILVVAGPSGCGKTTLLRVLAGLLPATAGRVLVDGAPVAGPGAERALVFQDDGLLPWRSVRRNVELPLALRGVRRRERAVASAPWIQRVGLAGYERHLPRELSGGMRQRVQLARALVAAPGVLLMDEPFGALDTVTRAAMQDLLVRVWRRHRTTLVFVTHDIDEALHLGDRVLVLGSAGAGPRGVVTVPSPRDRAAAATPETRRVREELLTLLDAGAPAPAPSEPAP